MTRRVVALGVLLLLIGAAAVLVLTRGEEDEPPPVPAADEPSVVSLLVVTSDEGRLAAVVGSGGSVAPSAIALPSTVSLTIPGQGDGALGETVELPGGAGATAVGNMLGVPVVHTAFVPQTRLVRLIDAAGGVDVAGTTRSGAEAIAAIEEAGRGRQVAWAQTLEGILDTVTWEATDLSDSDAPAEIAGLLNGARGATAQVLPTRDAGGGLALADADALPPLVATAFGIAERDPVPVVVLNGSGVPGIGQPVADRLIPGGFQVVVSENASSFDHDTTLVVASGEEARPLAERVRDLLGVGEVDVSGVPSGIADVTIVIGKDFQA